MKILILSMVFVLVTTVSGFSQSINGFSVPSAFQYNCESFYQLFDYTYMLASDAQAIYVVNKLGSSVVYDNFSTGIEGDVFWYYKPESFVYLADKKQLAIETTKGFFIVDQLNSLPKMKFIHKDNLPYAQTVKVIIMGMELQGNNGFSALGYYYDFENNSDCYYYLTSTRIVKLNPVTLDTISTHILPDDYMGVAGMLNTKPSTDMRFVAQSALNIFFYTNVRINSILSFNIYDKTYTIYGGAGKELPIPLETKGAKVWDYYRVHSLCDFNQSSDVGTNTGVAFATFGTAPLQAGKAYLEIDENVILYSTAYDGNHNVTAWDTMSIDLSKYDYDIAKDNYNTQGSYIDKIYSYKTDKIIATIEKYDPLDYLYNKPIDDIRDRTFLIIDLKNKTYTTHEIPLEFLSDIEVKQIRHIDHWTNPEGVHGIGIAMAGKKFIFWDPNYTSIEDTEEGIYQEIGIRSIYPNPATNRFNADILCYVQDISQVKIGLYNMFGQEVMDFTNNFEYSASTNTIHIDCNIPQNIARGAYYLKVNKGTETVTKPIAIY